MEKVQLILIFGDEVGKEFTIRIDDPRADLDETQIQEAMTEIITSNIFDSKGSDLIVPVGAKIVTTNVDEMEF